MEDIREKILKLNKEQKAKFYEEVDICAHDPAWYELHKMNYLDPNGSKITEIVYQEMVERGELKPI